MKNIARYIRQSRRISEYFNMNRKSELCDACECDPCDCNWGYSINNKIVISNGDGHEQRSIKLKKADQRSSN